MDGNKTNILRVGAWENAFSRYGTESGITVKPDFILSDPARFYVRVKDSFANTDPNVRESITVNIFTTSDPGADILLDETGINTGIFISRKWLLLTSVSIDEKYLLFTDTMGCYPLYFVKLGDKVTVTHGAKTAEATVPVEKVVKLHISILKDNKDGTAYVDRAVGEGYVEAANQIYAPTGIQFKATIQVVDPPEWEAGLSLINGFSIRTDAYQQTRRKFLSYHEYALLDEARLRTPATDDIEVYYIRLYPN